MSDRDRGTAHVGIMPLRKDDQGCSSSFSDANKQDLRRSFRTVPGSYFLHRRFIYNAFTAVPAVSYLCCSVFNVPYLVGIEQALKSQQNGSWVCLSLHLKEVIWMNEWKSIFVLLRFDCVGPWSVRMSTKWQPSIALSASWPGKIPFFDIPSNSGKL